MKMMHYKTDNIQFGVSEMWLYPVEIRKLGWDDCDGWAKVLMAYYTIAGVPQFRLRDTCGLTWDNFGHDTVHVLADDLRTWIHTNSTTPYSMINTGVLEGLPKTNDPSDRIGLKEIWFSNNREFSWHTFETSSAEDSYKEYKAMKNIKIKPHND